MCYCVCFFFQAEDGIRDSPVTGVQTCALLISSNEVSRFGQDFSFACGFVNGKELNMFATRTSEKEWTKDVYRFRTTDLKTWKKEMVLPRIGKKHILNTSVCKDPKGYLMAYESDGPTGWETWLARSTDLSRWDRSNGLRFVGVVFANPTIRHVPPYHYLMFGTHRTASPITDYEYHLDSTRSEERRVGKACRSRWSPSH